MLGPVRKIKNRISVEFKSLLLLLDLGGLLLILSQVYTWQFDHLPPNFWSAPGLWFIAFVTLCSMYIFGTYDFDQEVSLGSLVVRIGLAVGVGVISTLFVHYFFDKMRIGLFSRTTFLGSFLIFFFLCLLERLLLAWRHRRLVQDLRCLFVVSEVHLPYVLQGIEKHSFKGTVAFLVEPGFHFADKRILGDWNDLDRTLESQWSTVVVAAEASFSSETKKLFNKLMEARFVGHFVIDVGLFYEIVWRKVPLFYLTHSWFVSADGFGLLSDRVSAKTKRLTDLFFSLFLLILTWPFMLLTAAAVKLESPGPMLYRQIRTGQSGRNFMIYKFRSMRVDAEKNGAVWAMKNDERVTRVGKFIRLTRLDELPQLFNVFKGDMSFVGPRPERPEFNTMLAEKIPFYNLRHTVPPGITGWAQVLYPYGASVEDATEKLQYELYYIRHHSLLMDILIILKTVNVIVFGKGR